MLTNKITGFSADLLNTVRGILGEAKKCDDCGCGQCECEKEEVEEGHVPTADEPTDANKKTAQKIRDMMAKEKKPVKEESDLEEKRGLWDNIHAKRKRIKGGSGEKMRKPGSEGAPTAADFKASANEEVEQVDEVSKATLGRYINKAKDSIDLTAWRQGYKEGGAGNPSKPLEKKLTKRHKGISTAVKKLTKEDAEQIDELSKKTLGSYVKKASGAEQPKNVMSPKNVPLTKIAAYQGDSETGHFGKRFNQATYDKAERLRKNRETGIKTAVNKLTKEDAEQIDELSKGTMGRYINKAATKMGSQGVTAGLKIAADEKSSKNFKDMAKREKGIKLAVGKLTKEEQDFVDSLNDADMEQIDELSKETHGSYVKKAASDLHKVGADRAMFTRSGSVDKLARKAQNRKKGIDTAVSRMTKEDTEITEARGRPKKAGAKDFTIHPKTKEKLMHNNPEHMKKIERLQKFGVLEKPKVEAGQHIMNQLQKAKTSMLGGSKINFTHGDAKEVSGRHAAKILTKYAGMKPNEKEDFQKFVGHSHENLMKHV